MLDSAFCWAAVPRGVCLAQLITLFSLRSQIVAICGNRGIQPAWQLLQVCPPSQLPNSMPNQPEWPISPLHAAQAARAQVPGRFSCFRLFPTLLWLTSSDKALTICCDLGAAAAAYGLLSGSRVGAAVAWVGTAQFFW